MKRGVTLLLVVPTALALMQCADDPMPTAPDAPAGPSLAVSEVPGFQILPPLDRTGSEEVPGNAVTTLSPDIIVCLWDGMECVETVAQFSNTDGTGGTTIQVQEDGSQQVSWNTDDTEGGTSLQTGATYRVRFDFLGVTLGFVDFLVVENGKGKKANGEEFAFQDNGRTVPIHFAFTEDAFDEVLIIERSTFSAQTTDDQSLAAGGVAGFLLPEGTIVTVPGGGSTFEVMIAVRSDFGLPGIGACSPSYPSFQTGTCTFATTDPVGVTFAHPDNSAGGVFQNCRDTNTTNAYQLTVTEDDGQITFPEESPLTVPGVTCQFSAPPPVDVIGSNSPFGVLRMLARALTPPSLHAADFESVKRFRLSSYYYAIPVEFGVPESPDDFGQEGAFIAFQGQTLSVHFHLDSEHDGTPMPAGLPVSFQAAAGVLSTNLASTADAVDVCGDSCLQDGIATTDWTVPTELGTYDLTATVPGIPGVSATYQVTVTVPPA